MRAAYAPPVSHPRSESARCSLRVAVPDRLLCMTRFGLECAAEGPSGWWRQVEDAMQSLVDAHLPARAAEVEMQLDAERLEVVLSYVLPDASAGRVSSSAGAPGCA